MAAPWAAATAASASIAYQHREFLTFDQYLLLLSWPSCCAHRLTEGKKSSRKKAAKGSRMSFKWPALLLQGCAFLSSISLLVRGPTALDGAVLLPWAALMSLVHMTLPTPEIPLDQFIPWWSLLVITVVTLGNAESLHLVKDALGLQVGRFDGGPLLWSILCVIISTVALVAWSWYLVQGDHGPIQETLAPLMTPATVLPFAVINAFREEAQFRMLFLGASIAGEAEKSLPLMAYVMTIHSMYFALLHFLGGFPTGHSGFALVFIWSLFLDILRVWSGGMGLVFLLHVQADVAIFLLVWLEDQRKARRRNADASD